MRVVLDTDVVVSGLLSPYGAPGEVVRLAAIGALQGCYDARVLAEYRDVLLRPRFPFAQAHVDALVDQVKSGGLMVGARPLPTPLPDPDYEVFLAVALAGPAQHLISGDPRHYPAQCRQEVQVMSPAEFLAWYRQQAPSARTKDDP